MTIYFKLRHDVFNITDFSGSQVPNWCSQNGYMIGDVISDTSSPYLYQAEVRSPSLSKIIGISGYRVKSVFCFKGDNILTILYENSSGFNYWAIINENGLVSLGSKVNPFDSQYFVCTTDFGFSFYSTSGADGTIGTLSSEGVILNKITSSSFHNYSAVYSYNGKIAFVPGVSGGSIYIYDYNLNKIQSFGNYSFPYNSKFSSNNLLFILSGSNLYFLNFNDTLISLKLFKSLYVGSAFNYPVSISGNYVVVLGAGNGINAFIESIQNLITDERIEPNYKLADDVSNFYSINNGLFYIVNRFNKQVDVLGISDNSNFNIPEFIGNNNLVNNLNKFKLLNFNRPISIMGKYKS